MPRNKPDLTVSKKTFIDEIIHQNSKQTYPQPGASDYYFSSKAIKKFHADHEDLFAKKEHEETKKTALP